MLFQYMLSPIASTPEHYNAHLNNPYIGPYRAISPSGERGLTLFRLEREELGHEIEMRVALFS